MDIGVPDFPAMLLLGGFVFIVLALANINGVNGNTTIITSKANKRLFFLVGVTLIIIAIFIFINNPESKAKEQGTTITNNNNLVQNNNIRTNTEYISNIGVYDKRNCYGSEIT